MNLNPFEKPIRASDTCLFYSKRVSGDLLQQFDGAERICTDRIRMPMLLERNDKTLVFALPNALITNVTALCQQAGCTDVFVLVTDNGFQTEPIRVDVGKPRLDYLETEIARICNLHCRGCADFIQLAEDEAPFYDLDAFVLDLTQLKTKFWGIEKLRLLGGEPLLEKRIDAYVAHARRLFPDADIRIVTNGLLIPSLSADTLASLKRNGCSFDISQYPSTAQRKKEIVSALRSARVIYDFSPPIRYFVKTIRQHPSDDLKPSFDNCMFSHCHMMNQGGILSLCSYACCIHRFNRHFGTDYTESDYIDLYHTDMDGRQIMEWMCNPHLFCSCCSTGMVPIRWRDGVNRSDSVKEDWIIQSTFWSDHVIPFVQHMLMPAAMALRSFLQRNKSDRVVSSIRKNK